jgi:hypothetical protein
VVVVRETTDFDRPRLPSFDGETEWLNCESLGLAALTRRRR